MTKETPAIVLENVTRTLTEEVIPVTLVRDVSCVIDHGEFVAVIGASGSGKSSLLYLLGLLDAPTSGRILIDGQDMTAADETIWQKVRLEKIGFVFQFHFLIQEFSALDNIMLPMRKLGKLQPPEMKARAEYLLERFGLKNAGHKLPGQMSGGERQRVALARAMANNPIILLTDEPTGNLDSRNSDIVFEIFEELVTKDNTTVVTITHDLDLAARTRRQLRMHDGRLLP